RDRRGSVPIPPPVQPQSRLPRLPRAQGPLRRAPSVSSPTTTTESTARQCRGLTGCTSSPGSAIRSRAAQRGAIRRVPQSCGGGLRCADPPCNDLSCPAIASESSILPAERGGAEPVRKLRRGDGLANRLIAQVKNHGATHLG